MREQLLDQILSILGSDLVIRLEVMSHLLHVQDEP